MNPETLWLLAPLALGYAVVFWIVSVRFPAVPLVLIFGLAPFQNDVSGMGGLHFSLSEVHLLLSVPLLLWRGWSGGLSWMTFVLWGSLALTTLLTVPNWRDTTAVSLVQMALYWLGAVAVFCHLPVRRQDWETALKALIGVGVLLSIAALSVRSSYFWGLNKNGIGASLACALVVTTECWIGSPEGNRRALGGALLLITGGMVLVLSRGAWLSAATGVVFIMVFRREYRRLIGLSIVLAPVVAGMWMLLPQDSKDYALGFDSTRYNIKARQLNTEWVMEQWSSSPVYGVGVGLRKEYDATNVLWLTLAETGPLGLCAFLAVHLRFLAKVWGERLGTTGRLVGISPMPLAGALLLGKLLHGMVDHYWSRGAITVVWASVGIALSPSAQQGVQRRTGADKLQRRRIGGSHAIKKGSPNSEAILKDSIGREPGGNRDELPK
jgi:hypothetical protein